MPRVLEAASVVFGICTLIRAQEPPPATVGAQFDVVSIKLNTNGVAASSTRALPDGTQIFTNRTLASIVAAAAPEAVYDVVGLPQWAKTERYDIAAKPALDSHPTLEQRAEMLRNLFIDRMKFVAHIEEQERNGFALVVARVDGRLGPQLRKVVFDCARPEGPPCGVRLGTGWLDMKGMSLDALAQSVTRVIGSPVTNRTGVDGHYDALLRHAALGLNADPAAAPDDAPSIFTALQEQLGLKLLPEKIKVRILVVDRIERPTPN
jgi:uncharacterized protein (TIGR03435 family)